MCHVRVRPSRSHTSSGREKAWLREAINTARLLPSALALNGELNLAGNGCGVTSAHAVVCTCHVPERKADESSWCEWSL